MNISKFTEVRLKILDECFRSSRYFSVADLATKVEQRFEEFSSKESKTISKRQIQKDINFLIVESGMEKDDLLDIQLTGHNNLVPTYRYLDRTYRRGSQVIDNNDLEQLEIIIDQLHQFEGRQHLEWISTFRTRLGDQIDKSKKQTTARVIVSYDENDNLIGLNHFMPLYEHIRNMEAIQITYKPFQKDSRTFTFSPYHLKQFNNRWFVFGLDHEVMDRPSNLALDRIESLYISDKQYNESQSQNWDKYFKNFYGVTKEEAEPIEIKVKFTGLSWEYYISKPLHIEKKPINKTRVYAEDKSYMITSFIVIPNYEFRAWLRSFGSQIEIVEKNIEL